MATVSHSFPLEMIDPWGWVMGLKWPIYCDEYIFPVLATTLMTLGRDYWPGKLKQLNVFSWVSCRSDMTALVTLCVGVFVVKTRIIMMLMTMSTSSLRQDNCCSIYAVRSVVKVES